MRFPEVLRVSDAVIVESWAPGLLISEGFKELGEFFAQLPAAQRIRRLQCAPCPRPWRARISQGSRGLNCGAPEIGRAPEMFVRAPEMFVRWVCAASASGE